MTFKKLLTLLTIFFIFFTNATAVAHEWNFIDQKYWQVNSKRNIDFFWEKFRDCSDSGSVYVSGWMLQDSTKETVENLQKTTCDHWINKNFPERCDVFNRDKWIKISKNLPRKPISFCIDAYEYPNIPGQNPYIAVTWVEAQNICEEIGKRLCTEDEWTFACEGEEGLPYPYGYKRDLTICNIDRTWRRFDESKINPRYKAMSELDRLWQGNPSGDFPQCVSPFGVYDMTGNVDEWTVRTRPGKHTSILKGGYWGPVRTRCRPSTRNHDKYHFFYQQGFRCCSDPISDVVHPYDVDE